MRKQRRIAMALREAGALLTQARYLSYDLKETVHLGGGPTIVLLHGLYASAGVFRPLRRKLEREFDVSSYSLSYPPGPGIEEMCQRLVRLVERIESQSPIVLVGHSFGGLVQRYYVRKREVDPRVVQTVSLAAPFFGSKINGLVPGQGGRDLAPEATLLSELREASERNLSVPHLSLFAEEDRMIVAGAFPQFGEHRIVPRVGHNGILFDPEAIDQVARCVGHVVSRMKKGCCAYPT